MICGLAGGAAADYDPADYDPADFDAEAVFTTRCGACHTVGRGDDVGPDLAGVTERRDRDWLIPFIRSSQSVIASGDEVATELFERFGQTTMPDHPYSDEEIHLLLDYIEAGGPGDQVPRVRPAMDAVPEEVERGRRLFFGWEAFSAGGAACAHCHSVTGDGATLGGDLQDVYTRYQDREITRALIQMVDPVMDEAYRHRPLTDEENFALKAFLCRVSAGETSDEGQQRAQGGTLVPWVGGSLALILVVLGDGREHWRRRNGEEDRAKARLSATEPPATEPPS